MNLKMTKFESQMMKEREKGNISKYLQSQDKVKEGDQLELPNEDTPSDNFEITNHYLHYR